MGPNRGLTHSIHSLCTWRGLKCGVHMSCPPFLSPVLLLYYNEERKTLSRIPLIVCHLLCPSPALFVHLPPLLSPTTHVKVTYIKKQTFFLPMSTTPPKKAKNTHLSQWLPAPASLGNSTFSPCPTQFRMVTSLCPSLTCPTDTRLWLAIP
jgi:hypothetical protein